MQHISDERYLVTQLRNQRSDTAQRPPLDDHGWPLDRTLCPHCASEDSSCKVCYGSGVVCPTCRGSRVVRGERRVADMRPHYVGCPDCTDWLDRHAHEWERGSWPVFARVYRREASAIQYYRSRQSSFNGWAAD